MLIVSSREITSVWIFTTKSVNRRRAAQRTDDARRLNSHLFVFSIFRSDFTCPKKGRDRKTQTFFRIVIIFTPLKKQGPTAANCDSSVRPLRQRCTPADFPSSGRRKSLVTLHTSIRLTLEETQFLSKASDDVHECARLTTSCCRFNFLLHSSTYLSAVEEGPLGGNASCATLNKSNQQADGGAAAGCRFLNVPGTGNLLRF